MDSVLTTIPKIVSIFLLAWFSFWPAIPAGLALGLSPLVVIVTTTLSYTSGVGLVVVFGGWIRERIMRRLKERPAATERSLIRRAWDRFGTAGLGLLAPMTVGAQIGAALGLSLNAKPRPLFIWLMIGALAWSILLTVGVSLGALGVQSLQP